MASSSQHGFTPVQVELHLARVLNSEAFRASKRSQDFIRYVVTAVLSGNANSLKERNIATDVFGRGPDYDSAENSFVRVKASEVRRRLAAYYASSSPEDVLRIEIPLGTYVPQFIPIEQHQAEVVLHTPEVVPEPSAVPEVSRRPRWFLVIAAILTLGAIAALWQGFRPRSALDDFWSPILKTADPLVIFLPLPTSYGALREEEEARRFPDSPWVAVDGQGQQQFIVNTPHKVGLGAAIAAARFATLCAVTGKQYVFKAGSDLSFSDLRNQAAVILGAFSSPWTMEINNEYRFRMLRGPDERIVDSQNPSRQWRASPGRYFGTPTEDYAIAGRVLDSKSGHPVIIAAGISTFGTQAAAEFLTEPRRLAELAGRAPNSLSKGNFQVLLHTKIIGNTPTPARIIDAHFW